MNYLSFQPAFDVFHTEFRFLRLRRLMSAEFSWHFDQLRIADFYLLFFFRLDSARLSKKHLSFKKLARNHSQGRYERQPDDQLLFARMERIQRAAAGTLVANGYFDVAGFKSEIMIETGKSEPEVLSQRIDQLNFQDAQLLEALHGIITEYELLGADGLKARTSLLEYRYDAI